MPGCFDSMWKIDSIRVLSFIYWLWTIQLNLVIYSEFRYFHINNMPFFHGCLVNCFVCFNLIFSLFHFLFRKVQHCIIRVKRTWTKYRRMIWKENQAMIYRTRIPYFVKSRAKPTLCYLDYNIIVLFFFIKYVVLDFIIV